MFADQQGPETVFIKAPGNHAKPTRPQPEWFLQPPGKARPSSRSPRRLLEITVCAVKSIYREPMSSYGAAAVGMGTLSSWRLSSWDERPVQVCSVSSAWDRHKCRTSACGLRAGVPAEGREGISRETYVIKTSSTHKTKTQAQTSDQAGKQASQPASQPASKQASTPHEPTHHARTHARTPTHTPNKT